MKRAVYSGSFDPITKGHISVLARGAKVFDEVIVAVAEDNYKTTLFDLDERLRLIEASIRDIPNARATKFSGLLMDFAQEVDAAAIIRGLRVVSDFEYEMQMASFNKHLCPHIETVFFTADNDYSYVSSSMIRSIAEVHGDISFFITPPVQEALERVYGAPLKKVASAGRDGAQSDCKR